MTTVDARWALTTDGWQPDVRIAVVDGRVDSIAPAPAAGAADAVADLVVPGMPNAHCHAVQYAIAGAAERASGRRDSFWTWRERMYTALGTLDAGALERTATALYGRMRAAGYTSVAEFHYVHRAGGEPGRRAALATATESAAALARAAAAAGVSLLLLPVLYRWGGFGRAELAPRQARFALARDDYGRLLEALLAQAADPSHRGALRVGVAPHSLRAVDADDLRWLLSLRGALAPDCPVHLHVAEQVAEVEDARTHLGTTPIAWLLDHQPVDARWTLVHATHAKDDERAGVLERGATVCLCPTTEANLGDGYFPVASWFAAGGALAIGSDSNVGLDPGEELRWLEYQARLAARARSVLVDADCPHPGTALWRRAVAGGRRAFGVDAAGLAPGAPAELLLLDTGGAADPDEAMDDWVFARRRVRAAGTVTPGAGSGAAADRP
jgi:formimidoylglutamate deiminase